MMGDLRLQEISLNDDERKRRSAEQILRVEEKQSATNHVRPINRRGQMLSEYDHRASRERDAKRISEERTLIENRKSDSPVDRRFRKRQILKNRLTFFDAHKAYQYHDRQNQARERQTKHQAAVFKRAAAITKSLPVSP